MSSFEETVQELITFFKTSSNEIDFVEGEEVEFTQNIDFGDGEPALIGTHGKIIRQWFDSFCGQEAGCYFIGIDYGSRTGACFQENINTIIRSVDPRWIRPPQLPYEIGRATYQQGFKQRETVK